MAADTTYYDDHDRPDDVQPPAHLDAPAGGGIDDTSDLARLTHIAAESTDRTIDLPIPDVPGREGVRLRFQVGTLTGGQLRRWQKTATRGRNKDVDGFVFNSLLVAELCTAITVAGQMMRDDDGDPYTFRSADLIAKVGASTAAEAASRFIGSDGVIGSLTSTVLDAAGFGGDLEPDPTGEG